MKKFVLAGLSMVAFASAANAQDTQAAAPAAPFAGPYVGVQVGYVEHKNTHWDLDYWYDNYQGFEQKDGNAAIGIRAGYDAQLRGGLLVGALAEFSITDLNSVDPVKDNDDTYEIGAKAERLGSIRAKLGYANDDLAIYATGGLGFANIKHHMQDIDGSTEGYDKKGDRTGLVYGLGAAYRVGARSNIALDVSQYEFGNKVHEVLDDDSAVPAIAAAAVGTDYFFKQKDRIRTVTLSFNYGF